MNSIRFIVMACMITVVIGSPVTFKYWDQDYALCGELYTSFVKNVCNDHFDKFVGSIDEREKLLNQCCLTKCSSLQIVIYFCPGQRDNITETIFIPPPLTTVSLPETTTTNGAVRYIEKRWNLLNRGINRLMYGGVYE